MAAPSWRANPRPMAALVAGAVSIPPHLLQLTVAFEPPMQHNATGGGTRASRLGASGADQIAPGMFAPQVMNITQRGPEVWCRAAEASLEVAPSSESQLEAANRRSVRLPVARSEGLVGIEIGRSLPLEGTPGTPVDLDRA